MSDLISLSDYVREWRNMNRNPPLKAFTAHLKLKKGYTPDAEETHLFGGIDSAGEAVCSPDCWCNRVYSQGDEEE